MVSLAETGEQVAGGRTYVSSETNPRRIPLEDGRYQAEVAAVGIKGTPKFAFDFEISEGSQVVRAFDFSAGEIAVKVTRNGELSDAVVSIRAADGTRMAGGRTYRSASHNPKILRLAAGTYEVSLKSVEMRNGPEPAFEGVVVNGGERTELEHAFVSGMLSVGTRRGTTLVDSVVNVIDDQGRNIGGGRTYVDPSSNPRQFVLAPGAYTIRIAERRGEKREVEARVEAGGTTEILIDLDQP